MKIEGLDPNNRAPKFSWMYITTSGKSDFPNHPPRIVQPEETDWRLHSSQVVKVTDGYVWFWTWERAELVQIPWKDDEKGD